jgi:hypothetical protein
LTHPDIAGVPIVCTTRVLEARALFETALMKVRHLLRRLALDSSRSVARDDAPAIAIATTAPVHAPDQVWPATKPAKIGVPMSVCALSDP